MTHYNKLSAYHSQPHLQPTPNQSNPSNTHSLDQSSTSYVISKLSSTRKLLEQTLNKKYKFIVKHEEEPESDLHHELSSPTFSHLNQIYSSYSKAPSNSKLPQKAQSPVRTESAPPVFLKTKEKMKQEHEEKLKKECTFKPAINKKAHKSSAGSEDLSENKKEWLKKMSQPRAEIIEQREKCKREEEERKTFSSGFTKSLYKSGSESRIEDRLYSKDSKAAKYEKMKREKEEMEAAAFSYSPQISQSKRNSVPLYKRFTEVQQEKNLSRLKEKEKQEEREKFTFRPYVSPISKRMASSKCSGEITERLSRDSSVHKSLALDSSISAFTQPCKSVNSQEFLDRQADLYVKSQKEKEELVNKAMKNFKFTPALNENSNFIASLKHNYKSESLSDKVERLSKGDLKKKAENQQKLEKKALENYKFEPEINHLSRQLAKGTKFEKINERKEKWKVKAQASVAEMEKLCSFSPEMKESQKFEGVLSKYRQDGEIMKEIEKERLEKIRNERMVKGEREAQDMGQCTFKPRSFGRVESESNVKVKGVERFYELRNLAFRQKYEKEEREKKVLYKDQVREMIYSPSK